MATEKILSTRIKLRYDSYLNWTTKNPTLLDGEVALAYIETPNATQEVGSISNADSRQVLMKVGPGAYNDLQFLSAKAADVHSWAKKTESEFTTWVKSLVSVDDIDLSNYFTKGEVNAELAKKVDKVEGSSLVADTEITKLAGVSEGANKVEASTNGNIKIDGVDTVVYAHPDKHAIADVDGLQDALDGKVAKDGDKVLTTNDLTNELKGQYDAAYAHSQVAHAPADAQANVIESVKVNGEALTITDKAVDVIVPTKVSDLENDSAYLVAADIANKADKATTLAGYGIGDAYTKDEVDDEIEGAINTFVSAYITSNGGAIDKLQEIADWIDSDKNGAADIVADVEANAEGIENLGGRMDAVEDTIEAYGDMVSHNVSEFYTKEQADAAFTDSTEVDGQIDAKITALGLGTMSKETATDYVKKTEAVGYDDILTKTAAAEAYQAKGEYYTKSEADAAFTDSTEVDNQIDAKITALDLANTYQAKGDYATAEQGGKADTAIQTISTPTTTDADGNTVPNGLKAVKTGVDVAISIDEDVVFVLDCGTSGGWL